jgi:septal ring factor EnvC (AmiA/AmiB activator)
MSGHEDDWFPLEVETKLNKKIDALQTLVHQQSEIIEALSSEIKQLKGEMHFVQHAATCQHLSSQNDRTHQLLEELKVLKQREINMMLREKIPVPFYSTQSSPIPNPFSFSKRPETAKIEANKVSL